MLYWNPNTLVLPQGAGLLRLFQVSRRRNVLATKPIVELIDLAVGGCRREDFGAQYERLGSALRLADATTFTLWQHAHSNSDFFDRSVGLDALEALPLEEGIELLTETGVLSSCWPPPTDNHKRSFGDRFRGKLYEQLATEALYERTTPAAWWTAQKFTADFTQIRPTPYRFIEEEFLDNYFRDHLRGLRVLEIGCGTGYFTAKIATHAGRAVGMDFNEEYIAIARKTWTPDRHPNLEFQVGDIIDLSRGGWSERAHTFDRIVLIDTFLFLFDPSYQQALYENRDTILGNLRRLLAPGGQLLIMDPHPLWLTPWLGNEEQPFGIISEYRQRAFKVSPSIEEISSSLYGNGLRIRRILEPAISAAYKNVDPQAHALMTQLPQWWFWEVEAAA
jgi:SAM-dependent methyltransferase